MKLPKGIPHFASWVSAVALFFFAMGTSALFAFVMPFLAELMRKSPRLALIGMLVTWLSPIAVAGTIHRFTSGILDVAEPKARRTSVAASAWAGVVAWSAVILVSLTASFVMLILDPPPVDPDRAFAAAFSVADVVTRGVPGVVHIGVWIVLAAYVYELERLARSEG